jgi:hypothetical protein
MLERRGYATWTAGAPAGMEKTYAFLHAAAWADDIKERPNYHNGKAADAATGQNGRSFHSSA